MGRGDKRSRRGKIWRGTYGNTRPRKKANGHAKPAAPVRKKTTAAAKPVAAKAARKAEPAKKTEPTKKAEPPKKAEPAAAVQPPATTETKPEARSEE